MGIYLSKPKTDKSTEDGENGRLKFGLSSMQGWRASMEDAHCALPDLDACTSFFGVYDGHGGSEVAEICSKNLHVEVLKSEAYGVGNLAASIQNAFFRMDTIMKDPTATTHRQRSFQDDKSSRSSNGQQEGPTSGSTACVALIRGNQLIVANAGDSRCVISRKGQAYDLSRDHKPHLEREKERILKAGGFIHAGRVNGSLNLARAIGDLEFKQNKYLPAEKQIVTALPDISIVELSDDDEFLVLACDGVWDVMSSQVLVDFIHEKLKEESKLSEICNKVLDKCLAPSTVGGEGCDNMTIILVQFRRNFTNATSSNSHAPPSSSSLSS